MALLGIFSNVLTKKLKLTKSNKGRTWIYQCHNKNANTWSITMSFYKNKEKEKEKKRLIRDKVKTKNAEMRVIMWEGESKMMTE